MRSPRRQIALRRSPVKRLPKLTPDRRPILHADSQCGVGRCFNEVRGLLTETNYLLLEATPAAGGCGWTFQTGRPPDPLRLRSLARSWQWIIRPIRSHRVSRCLRQRRPSNGSSPRRRICRVSVGARHARRRCKYSPKDHSTTSRSNSMAAGSKRCRGRLR
jgi:hypothetical protein